jgi:broad specificity phosphatase PhoE
VTAERTTVHLVRHGEVFNPEKILYGRLPGFRLSESGERMAELASAYLAGRDIRYLVASPMDRAQQTAAPFASEFGLQIATDDRLIEATNVFEGKRLAPRGVLLKPSNWRYYRNPLRPSWGEPYLQVAQRMMAAALSARDRADGHEAVCISHQLPIVSLRRYAECQHLWHDPRKRQCSLASITSLTFIGERIVRVAYAEPAGTSENSLGKQPPGS